METLPAIIWYDVIDSTNSEVARHIDDLDNLSVVAAIEQTAGRGQGDHKWHSRPGENLTFTAVLKFGKEGALAPLAVRDALYITEIITLALRRLLSSHGIEARIKWPNDIYVGDDKICGILIENRLSGKQVVASIIGVGLNVNQTRFPEDLPNPVSMAVLTQERYDIKELMIELQSHISDAAALSNSTEGRATLDSEFNAHMFKKEGETREVSPDGSFR